ncbi:MAG: hemerythrin family protein [Bacteroidota bacterium]
MSDHLTIDSLRMNKKKIEELIQFFSKSIEEKKCKNEIVNVFHKISFYTHDFFINEELFMKKYKIPSFSKHVNEHREFADKMICFQKEFEENKPRLCNDLLAYLKLWYDKHILNSDEEIIAYIKDK